MERAVIALVVGLACSIKAKNKYRKTRETAASPNSNRAPAITQKAKKTTLINQPNFVRKRFSNYQIPRTLTPSSLSKRFYLVWAYTLWPGRWAIVY